MANLTITIEDSVLRKARMLALERGTSVNAVIREYLEAYTGARSEQAALISEIIALSKKSCSRRGSRKWTRGELYDRE